MIRSQLRRQPLYTQIKTLLSQRIGEGAWQPNEMLPSEWELAEELGVSQGTVRKALTEMVTEGMLYRQQGKGTFVADVMGDWAGPGMVPAGLFRSRLELPAAELLGCSRVNAPDELAEALGLKRGAVLVRVRQLWRLQAEALAVDDAYLPAERIEGLDAKLVRQSGGSVYNALHRHYAVRPVLVQEQLRAVPLPREEGVLLGVAEGVPVLSITRLTASLQGEPVEWRQRYCLTRTMAYVPDHGRVA